MEIPTPVKTVVLWLNPDFYDSDTTTNEILGTCMRQLDQQEKRVIIQFIETLEGAELQDDELQRLWWRTGASFYVSNAKDIMMIFNKVREAAMLELQKLD